VNELESYFRANTGRLIHKWEHYFEIYDRHFARFRGREVNVLEIGVYQGGSLQMWKHYFGPKARIFGMDINPACSTLAEERIKIYIGDQSDRSFLRTTAQDIGRIDVLIDDGGHEMNQLTTTFEELFPRVDANGVYLAEDLHTCYWPAYGGGFLKPASFIEYSKRLIDQLNAWHAQKKSALHVDDFTRSAHSMHYYDSILAIEKRPISEPSHSQTGEAQLPAFTPPQRKRTGSWFRRMGWGG